MATPPEFATPQQEPFGPERRNVSGAQVGAIVGGLLLLVVVLWFLFLRGGGDEDQAAAPAPIPTVQGEAPSPEPTAVEPPGQGPVETFEVFAPKDPFQPLISPDAAGASGGGDAAGGDGGTDGGTPTGPDGSAAPTGGSGAGGDSIGGHRVRVVEVREANGRATIQVDGTVYEVEEGEQFADNFELVGASRDCATMLFGDDEFTLCEGEAILK
jgi:hypothetical protein